MTQKEIDKLLANTKVYVNGKSKEIQEKLFSLGYKWTSGDIDVDDIDYPFLFIYPNKSFAMGRSMTHFSAHVNREISAEEILSIEPTEPSYRPFKNKEECWNEMLKHQPFVCLKHKEKQIYDTCICVGKNGIEELSYEFMYKYYTFADDTPFGIKEE